MCIFMLPIMHELQTPNEHHAILDGFFFILYSAVIWISASNSSFFINISFLA